MDVAEVERVSEIIANVDPEVEAENPNVQISGKTVSAGGFEAVIPHAESVAAAGGTHVYETAQGRAAIREMNDGFQVVKVVEEKSGTSDMVVSFPGRHLEQMEDGRVIIRQGGEYGEPVGVIDPAWAKGADGAEVATRFEISGSELVQVVVPESDTKFPVVADPRVRTAWYGASIDFTKQETTRMAAGWGACAAVMAVVPDFTASKALAAACGVLSAVAGGAASEGKCVSVKFIPLSPIKVVPWLTRCYA